MNKLHIIKLLALKTVKARYIINAKDELFDDLTDVETQKIVNEMSGEIKTLMTLGELIGGIEFERQYRKGREQMLSHDEDYHFCFIDDMIEYFEKLVSEE